MTKADVNNNDEDGSLDHTKTKTTTSQDVITNDSKKDTSNLKSLGQDEKSTADASNDTRSQGKAEISVEERMKKILARIDSLQSRIETSVSSKRRRAAHRLDDSDRCPSYRRSHLRLHAHHQCSSSSSDDGGTNNRWTLVIEGVLLVGSEAQPSPVVFTHLFDRAEFHFGEATGAGRKRNRVDEEVHAKTTTTLVWEREKSSTADVNAFHAVYVAPPSSSAGAATNKPVHAKVSLFPRWWWGGSGGGGSGSGGDGTTHKGGDDPPHDDDNHHDGRRRKRNDDNEVTRYLPSDELVKLLLPNFYRGRRPTSTSSSSRRTPKDRHVPSTQRPWRWHIPATLTMGEAVTSVFLYVRSRGLQDRSDRSIVNNDANLSKLFGCRRMLFSKIRELLMERRLLTEVTRTYVEPIVLDYVLSVDDENDHDRACHVLVDVTLPSRDRSDTVAALRAVKRRELEYTGARARALKGFLDRSTLERTVAGDYWRFQHLTDQEPSYRACLTVGAALARSAPPGSEARKTAAVDARLCLLTDRQAQRLRAAQTHADLANACGLSTASSSSS